MTRTVERLATAVFFLAELFAGIRVYLSGAPVFRLATGGRDVPIKRADLPLLFMIGFTSD